MDDCMNCFFMYRGNMTAKWWELEIRMFQDHWEIIEHGRDTDLWLQGKQVADAFHVQVMGYFKVMATPVEPKIMDMILHLLHGEAQCCLDHFKITFVLVQDNKHYLYYSTRI